MQSATGESAAREITSLNFPMPTLLNVKRRLQIADQHAHVGISFVRVALETLEDRFFQRRRNVRVQLARRDEVDAAVKMPAQNLLRRVAGKRLAVGEQFVGGDAVGEDVRAVIERLA